MKIPKNLKEKIAVMIHPFTRAMDPGTYLRWFLGVTISLFVLYTAFIWFVDPYMYYHRAIGLKQVYDNSQAMIPGIMRHCQYDAVLFGSSMTQNFNIAEINDIFDVKCIKATSAGLTGETFDQYFRFAKKSNPKGLKRCFIGVDIFSFAKIEEDLTAPYRTLYGDSLFPAEYFYSSDTLEAAFRAVWINLTAGSNPVSRQRVDFNQMFSNKVGKFEYSREIMEKSIMKMDYLPKAPDENTIRNFETLLFVHIRNNPHIEFDLFLPPYSIYFWNFQKNLKHLDAYFRIREYLAREAAKLPNVRLHDFQSDWNIVCKLDNYKDITHYSPAINSEILKGIKSGKYCIRTAGEMRESSRQIRLKLGEYDSRFNEIYSRVRRK